MTCLHEGETKILQVFRRQPSWWRRRRICSTCGAIFDTYEVGETVLNRIGRSKFVALAASHRRNVAMLQEVAQRREATRTLVAAGHSNSAIAKMLNVSEMTIRNYRKKDKP